MPNVYCDIKKHAGKHTLMDYDALVEVGEIKDYLLKQGLIDENYRYEDDELKKRYYAHLEYLKKDARISIGTTY